MTIVALEREQFGTVIPLYQQYGKPFPLISAVINDKQRGQVFADEPTHPQSALIVTNFGFTLLVGTPNASFNRSLALGFSTADQLKPSYLLWYSPPAAWQRHLDTQPTLVRRRERVRFKFPVQDVSWLKSPIQIPAGFELADLSLDLIAKVDKFNINLDSRFWTSAEDLLQNGVGVCLMRGNEVISMCYTAAVADGLGEIDVVTDPEFRGSGLGCCVAQELIRQCLSREIVPTWDCFLDNIGSMRLAEKLEFTSLINYPFYSFNVPIHFAHVSENSRSNI